MSGTLQTDNITNAAGTGAPTFTNGIALSTSQVLQADTITNAAGTGAPTFSQGANLTATKILKADTIQDAAGTGSPNFTNGLKLSGGSTAIAAYSEGTWTPSGNAASYANIVVTGALTFTNARYTQIGNMVYCRIYQVSAATSIVITTASNTDTRFSIGASGLPSFASGVQVFGSGSCGVLGSNHFVPMGVINDSGANAFIDFQFTGVNTAANGASINFYNIFFQYATN